MKLKSDVFVQEFDDSIFLILSGSYKVKGFVRSNRTAGFILRKLQEEITEPELLEALCEKYDAPETVISEDLEKILQQLRGLEILKE